jgi:hypothetical protein
VDTKLFKTSLVSLMIVGVRQLHEASEIQSWKAGLSNFVGADTPPLMSFFDRLFRCSEIIFPKLPTDDVYPLMIYLFTASGARGEREGEKREDKRGDT